MRVTDNQGSFPLGLIVFSGVLAVYKGAVLSVEMTGTYTVLARLLSLDISFLAILGFVALLCCHSARRWSRLALKTLLAVLVVFYAVHSFVLLALDETMSLFDLGRYLLEWRVVLSFFDALTVAAFVVFLFSLFLDIQLKRRVSTRWFLACAVVVFAGFALTAKAPFQLQKYAVLQTDGLLVQFSETPGAKAYSLDDLEFYSAATAGPVEFRQDDPNIILLIVESLSSINSSRVSGERDLLGKFDEISADGVLFRNFFANHSASEGGIISLLSGFPPLHYPGATPLMFDEFAHQPSVIGAYQQRGYFIEFLTNADLGFIGLDRYISGLDFDLARGRDEIPVMAQATRIVQNAPADSYLYSEALDRTVELLRSGRPWLMAVATVSTHLPYTHPQGGENTELAVWEWSLEQLDTFYQDLEATGFFEGGILLISGDHRQMRPLTIRETERYGDSAKARIPLLAIGEGLPAGELDERFFQQSDLLRYIGRIARPGMELSPHPIWVERYNRIYGKVDSINRFSVFDPADGGTREVTVRLNGTEFSWLNNKPAYSRKIEAGVHAQRSRHQFNRSGGVPGCRPDYVDWDLSSSAQAGVHLALVEGRDINGLASSDSNSARILELDGIKYPDGMSEAEDTVLWFRATLEVESPGLYWFRTAPGNLACLGIDQQLVLDQLVAGKGGQGSIELDAGLHALDLRFVATDTAPGPGLQWVTPGLTRWRWRDVPSSLFHPPADAALDPARSPGD